MRSIRTLALSRFQSPLTSYASAGLIQSSRNVPSNQRMCFLEVGQLRDGFRENFVNQKRTSSAKAVASPATSPSKEIANKDIKSLSRKKSVRKQWRREAISKLNESVLEASQRGNLVDLADSLSAIQEPNIDTFKILLTAVARYGDAALTLLALRKIVDVRLRMDETSLRLALRAFFESGRLNLAVDLFRIAAFKVTEANPLRSLDYLFLKSSQVESMRRSQVPFGLLLDANLNIDAVAVEFSYQLISSKKRAQYHKDFARMVINEVKARGDRLEQVDFALLVICAMKMVNYQIKSEENSKNVAELARTLRPILSHVRPELVSIGWKTYLESQLFHDRHYEAIGLLFAAIERKTVDPQIAMGLIEQLMAWFAPRGLFKQAQKVIEEMGRVDFKPSPRLFELLLLSYTKKKPSPSYVEVVAFVDRVIADGFLPRTTLVFNIVLAALRDGKDTQSAFNYFNEFLSKGAMFDGRSIGILLHGFALDGNLDGVISVTKAAKASGLLNAFNFSTLFLMFREPKGTPETVETHRLRPVKNFSFNDAELGKFLRECFEAEAYGVEPMIERRPELSVRGAMLYQLSEAFNNRGLNHDRVSAGALLNVFTSLGMFREAFDFSTRLDENIALDSVAMWHVILASFRFQKFSHLVKVYRELWGNLKYKMANSPKFDLKGYLYKQKYQPIEPSTSLAPPVQVEIEADRPLPTEGGLCCFITVDKSLDRSHKAVQDFFAYNYGKRRISAMPLNLMMKKALKYGYPPYILLSAKMIRFVSNPSKETLQKSFDVLNHAVKLMTEIKSGANEETMERFPKDQEDVDAKLREKLQRDPFTMRCYDELLAIRDSLKTSFGF